MGNTERPYRVLILYTELAQYILSSISRFVERNEAEVLIVRWPLNKEAPFEFEYPTNTEILDRTALNNDELIEKAKAFDPDVILTSGWVDKGYTLVCKEFKNTVLLLLCVQTQNGQAA